MKLKDMDIGGENVEIHVDDDGEFSANVDGQWHRHTMLQALRKAIVRTVRSQARGQVAIPATLMLGGRGDQLTLKPCVITGQSLGNSNILIRLEDGSRQQLSPWANVLLIATTEQEREEYARLERVARRAASTEENWREARKMDAREAIRLARSGESVVEAHP